ncbi:MAG: dihydroneopterin aldolase [Gammaproteobacteria bacterium]|nr:dihydroneopterin aldolase [Gammaproteobacteria bacterium]
MDIIYLHGLAVNAQIGVWDWEKQITQRLTIDLDMGADIRIAAVSDRLQDTLNYKEVAKRVISFVEDNHFNLVEALAEKIADILLDEFEIPWCRIKLNKMGAINGGRDVGVIIERGKAG